MRDYSALHVPVEGQALGRTKTRIHQRRLKPDRVAELLAAICIAMLFTVCGAVYYCSGLLASDKFYGNIYVDDVSVSGMTKAEALDQFAELQSTDPAPIQVQADGKTWQITAQDISARYSVAETISAAWDVGRKGNVLQELGDILALRSIPQRFMFTVLYDDAKLKDEASEISIQASTTPQDAVLQFQPTSQTIFAITSEVDGKAVDADALYKQLHEKLGKRVETQIDVQSAPVQPGITTAQLQSQTQLIGACTTGLTLDAVRNKNISLAAAAVSGAVIAPGYEFSFNTLTGERTEDKGYSMALAISAGKLVDEIGGGVCQVSTTIYDAALLAGLEVVERHPHTWPMYYVKAGMDAMVDYGNRKDLRLKNNMNVPVYLIVRVDEAKRMITAEFYGLPSPDAITVEQRDYEVITPDKPIEQRNDSKSIGWSKVLVPERKGYKVSVFRVFTSGGDSRQELLYNDYYPPEQGKVEVGTKSPPGHNK